MQILIPMGGAGSRFSAAGFEDPKPFIEFLGKTMIENVVENLGYRNDYIMVMQSNHYKEYNEIFTKIAQKVSGFDAILLNGLTKGATESCLAAEDKLDPDSMLMIANCDQITEFNHTDFKSWLLNSNLDGAIMTFDSQSDKMSYAELDSDGLVCRTVEKQVISPHATSGIYVWRKAGDFIKAAKQLIDDELKTNGEYYVAPVYNINIRWGQKIGIYHVREHHSVGSPQELTKYLDYLLMKDKK